jgi:plastocyanin
MLEVLPEPLGETLLNSTPTVTILTVTVTTAPTPTAPATPIGDDPVLVRDNAFDPAELTIRVGESVTWYRFEGYHSVTADDGSFEQPAGNT